MNVFVVQPEFTVEEEDLLVFPSVHDGEARTIEQNKAEYTLEAQDETSEPMIVPGGLVEFAIQELGATLVCVEEYIVEE